MRQRLCIILLFFSLSTATFSNAEWLCQRYNFGQVTTVNGSVTIKDTTEPIGCIFKGFGMSDGEYYFRFQVEATDFSVAVGVTKEEALRQSGFKGFFYDENLTDGTARLREYFGKSINDPMLDQDYDTVDVLVKINTTNMKMYLRHGKLALGLSFDIDSPPIPLFPAILIRPLFPGSEVGGSSKVTFIRNDYQPDFPLYRSTDILDGSFQLTHFNKGNDEMSHLLTKCLDKNVIFIMIGLLVDQSSFFDEEAYHVSFNDEKNSGTLEKKNGKWTYDSDRELQLDDGSEPWKCISFIDNVLKNVESLEKTSKTIKVESKQDEEGKKSSFSGILTEKLSPKPVTKNIFDGND